MTAKKTVTRNRPPTVANNQNGSSSRKWENNQGRIFELKRKKVEYNLDTLVTDTLAEYEKYLQELYALQPNTSGIVEAILLDSFDGHSDFQKWRVEQEKKRFAEVKNNSSSGGQENDILETDENFDALEQLGQHTAATGAK